MLKKNLKSKKSKRSHEQLVTMEGQKAKHLSREKPHEMQQRERRHTIKGTTSLGLKSGNLALKQKGPPSEMRLATWGGRQLNVEVVGVVVMGLSWWRSRG